MKIKDVMACGWILTVQTILIVLKLFFLKEAPWWIVLLPILSGCFLGMWFGFSCLVAWLLEKIGVDFKE